MIFTLAEKRCSNPNGEIGECIPLRNCNHLYQLLATRPLSDESRNFLSRSQCGYDNRTPYVSIRILSFLSVPCVQNNEIQIHWKFQVCCVSNSGPPATPPTSTIFTGASGLTQNDFPPPGACGSQVDSRIFGGNATGIYQYPW